MAIKVACACGKKLSVKDEHAGRRVRPREEGHALGAVFPDSDDVGRLYLY
jgi:hypothetical protein